MSVKGNPLPLKFKSIDDLKFQYERLKLSGQEPRKLVLKLNDIVKKAEERMNERDQEDAYVLYMKYLSVVAYIQSTEDYKKDATYYKAMMGKKPLTAMKIAETLHEDLNNRYAVTENSNQVTQNNMKNLGMSKDTAVAPKLIEPPDMRFKKETASTTISSVDLFNMLKNGVTKVLVIDTRPSEDFQASRLNESCVISIADEIIKLGMSAYVLEQQLSSESMQLWSVRGSYDQIVLLDWNTGGKNLNNSSKVCILKNILKTWDVFTTYKNSNILILDGGYEDWLNSYPWYTTSPKPQKPMLDEAPPIEFLDSVVYPELEDLNESVNQGFLRPFFDRSQKPTSRAIILPEIDFEEPPPNDQPAPKKSVPEFDRAKKTAAIKTYEERKADMEDLLKQKEIETSEAVELEKSMIDSELELQENIRKQGDVSSVDVEERLLLEEQEEQLLMKVEELKEESIQKDNKIKELQEIIEIYEKRDAEEIMKKERDEERRIKEAEMNEKIKQQEEEKMRLAEERKMIEQEKDLERYREKLEAARKNKRRYQNDVSHMEGSQLEPVIPQINRSNKPKPIAFTEEKVRNFNPTKGRVGRGLTGLKNLGNTCYMNSILQCISNNSALAKYFCDDHYRQDVNRSNKTKGEIAEEVAAVVKTLWSGHFRAIACKDLKGTVGSFKPEYGSYEQQDSHEFLTFLMDWLHNDLNKIKLNNKLDGVKSMSDMEKAWWDFKKKNESLISTLFYGLQKSTVRCLRCGEESVTYEPFSNLSLIIPDGESSTLMQCLQLYLKGERISGWRCPKCKELRDAEKKTDICKLPPILVIHLKRFHYIDVLSRKRTTYIDFPLTDLNMAQLVYDNRQRGVNYDLYGVSNHYGTMQGGHYTAYCKSALFKKWYKFDDHEVVEMSPSEVKSNAAYILFYTSISYQVPESVS